MTSVSPKKGEHPLLHLALQNVGMLLGAGIMTVIALYEQQLQSAFSHNDADHHDWAINWVTGLIQQSTRYVVVVRQRWPTTPQTTTSTEHTVNEWMSEWLIDCWTDRLDWLIDWSTEWLSDYLNSLQCECFLFFVWQCNPAFELPYKLIDWPIDWLIQQCTSCIVTMFGITVTIGVFRRQCS